MFCRLYQWRIENEMDDYGRIKHSRTLRHLESCSSCQGWLQSLKQIDRHLQTDSPLVSNLRMRQVQTAVQRHWSDATVSPLATTHYKTTKPYRFRYALVVAAVMMVTLGVFSFYSPESNNRNRNEMVESMAQLSQQLQWQIPALASLPEQVLESEIQSMETDVRHAIGFIRNCLPQGFVATHFSSESSDLI